MTGSGALAAELADRVEGCRLETAGGSTVEVPGASWRAAAACLVESLEGNFFDWLSAVDLLEDGVDVVAHLWSVRRREGVLLRTRMAREEQRLDSLAPVIAGAAWHEREVHEMFGVEFVGHPAARPLLLPAGFDGHPLRKNFVLSARVDTVWPGAVDPAVTPGRTRRRPAPPGVSPLWARDSAT